MSEERIMGELNGLAALPKENLVRAVLPGPEFRDASEAGGQPTLAGHFAVFNEWTEIDSWMEGNFLERIAPGAFKKTFREQRNSMRVLLNHGGDPQLGDKPLGAITELREDDAGAYYEASLFDGIPPLVMDGLRAGQYGASFRFRVMREDIVEPDKPSDDNPGQLRERTIKEAQVMEFGPVTFPAYAGATAGVRSDDEDAFCIRSLTDQFSPDPDRYRDIIDQFGRLLAAHPPAHAAREEHLGSAPPVEKPTPAPTKRFRNREDYLRWLSTTST